MNGHATVVTAQSSFRHARYVGRVIVLSGDAIWSFGLW
jgi:hypothetical protein